MFKYLNRPHTNIFACVFTLAGHRLFGSGRLTLFYIYSAQPNRPSHFFLLLCCLLSFAVSYTIHTHSCQAGSPTPSIWKSESKCKLAGRQVDHTEENRSNNNTMKFVWFIIPCSFFYTPTIFCSCRRVISEWFVSVCASVHQHCVWKEPRPNGNMHTNQT